MTMLSEEEEEKEEEEGEEEEYAREALQDQEALRREQKELASVEADRRLKRIARAGKEWKRTMGRKVDMEGELCLFACCS